jgi:hypothetical protein
MTLNIRTTIRLLVQTKAFIGCGDKLSPTYRAAHCCFRSPSLARHFHGGTGAGSRHSPLRGSRHAPRCGLPDIVAVPVKAMRRPVNVLFWVGPFTQWLGSSAYTDSSLPNSPQLLHTATEGKNTTTVWGWCSTEFPQLLEQVQRSLTLSFCPALPSLL